MDNAALPTVVTALILDRPLCADCIAANSGSTTPDVEACIDRIRRIVLITVERWSRCTACGIVGVTYSAPPTETE
jgi:hypothetical protein